MGHDDDNVRELLIQLRAAVRGGDATPSAVALIDRLESALDRVLAESDALKARLERPPLGAGGGVTPGEPSRLEAWVRRLERPETTAQ